MYQPRSIKAMMEMKAESSSFAELLKEVNSTIDELNLWREAEKQKEEEFERNLQQKVRHEDQPQEEEEDEEMPARLAHHTIDFEKYRVKSQPFTVSEVTVPRTVELPSQPQFEGFQMFEAGHRLTELLDQFAADTGDVLDDKENVHHTEDWDQLDDIEKELRELEQLLDDRPA